MFSSPNNHNNRKGLIRIFGRNPDIDTATDPEDIWDAGGLYTFPSDSGEGMYISSSDASDSQKIKVSALDSNFVLQEFEITLNGQTKTQINSGTLYTRILHARNNDSTDLAGDIYIYTDDTVTNGVPDTASKVKAKINVNYQQTLMAIFTVPKGLHAEMLDCFGNISKISGSNHAADVEIKVREYGKVFRTVTTMAFGDGFFEDMLGSPMVIPEKSDVMIMCKTIKNNNSALNAGLDLVLF